MTPSIPDENVLRPLFNRFATEFRYFDGNRIAELFSTPYTAINSRGDTQVFKKITDIGEHFQRWLDKYKGMGVTHCDYRDLEVVPIGLASSIATVTWQLLNKDKNVVAEWRESYDMICQLNDWRIISSTDQTKS